MRVIVFVKKIVVVMPCHNEGESLPFTLAALSKIRLNLKPEYQLDLMLVNDGSSDNTQQLIEDAAKTDDNIYYRQFVHNAGHQSALRAGLNASVDYDAVIMMDADMQHPPELIPNMIADWEKGSMIVQMTRSDSVTDVGTLKYSTSKLYYKILNWISDLNLEYGASDFRLIDKVVTQTVAKSFENNLFLRGYFSWLPITRTTISYHPNKRIAGVSKYSFRKMLDLAYRGILQFSEKPLRMAMVLGIIFALGSFLYGVILTIQHFTGTQVISGWTSLMVVVLFCFGVNFILLGIIGTYLAHSIDIQKQRPEFVVMKEKLP